MIFYANHQIFRQIILESTVQNCLMCGTEVPDVWYRGACFLMFGWSRTYVWLEANICAAGGAYRKTAYLVPANAVC